MTLTATEIEARHSRIGASDVAAILGMPTFKGRNAYTCWLEKTGQLEPEKSEASHLNAGNLLEPVVLDYAERQHGALERNVVVFEPTGLPIASTLDARIVANGEPVEAKTSGIVGPLHGTWGEAGTDEVPDGYLIQCQTQILCTGADVCHLVALLGARGFTEFTIKRAEPLVKVIRDVASDFFERYVAAHMDPRTDWADRLAAVHHVTLLSDPCEPQLDVVKRVRRVPGNMITLDDPGMFIGWQALRQARLDAEKAEQAALAECLAQLGDAEAADLPGGVMFTYLTQKSADTIDRDAMKADGVYDTYAKPNTCRVARMKSPKVK